MEDASKVFDSLNNLINSLVHLLGKGWTIFFIIAVPIGIYLWKRYNNNRKDTVVDKLIKEKDETIRRMKDEIKMYRIHIFKEKGWTDEDIDKYIK